MTKLRCKLRTTLLTTMIIGLPWFPVANADLNEGLVTYYPFEENANDKSGNGNHGTEYGDTHYTTGMINQAREFDREGGLEYILIPNTFNGNEYSVSLWAKLKDIATHHSLLMLNSTTTSWSGSDFWLFTSNSRVAIVQNQTDLRYGSYNSVFMGSSELKADTDYLIVASYKNQQVTLYVNGELYAEYDNVAPIQDNFTDLNIGISPSGGGRYQIDGLIDELRIYNRALSECEIQSLYVGKDKCNPTLVTLNNFVATPFQNDIRIHWKTASEVDNAGFHIWRAIGEGWKQGDNSQVIRLTNQLIPSKGEKVGGYPYFYIDSNVESGITYYYGLEDIDFNGQSTVHLDFIDKATAK